MPHDTPLITTIVAALVLAYIFGAIANRLKMPPLVGYLIAGVVVGPHSPGFVADQTLASQLAEIGVILLMFGVGLNFSLKDLLSVRAVAVPGALIRMGLAGAMGFALAMLMDWPLMGGVVFGLALAVSSTVVTLKALQDRHLVDSDRGHIAMGWLIVEDLAMVLALVLIPAFAGTMGGAASGAAASTAHSDTFVALAEQLLHRRLDLWAVVALTLVKLLAFVGFMVVVGRRLIPALLHATAHTGSRELFRLAVLAVALGVAAGAAYLFGVSLALGAFFAGMILSESELSHRAAQETLPLRDAFGVLFFVSVGMLFDPSIIVRDPLPVLATLAIILFGKSIVGFLLLIIFRRPVAAALQVSAALAQIGEFSFILAALGVSLGLLPQEGRDLVLAGAIVSIVLNPLAFWVAERLRPRLETHAPRRSEPELGPIVPDHADEVEAAEPASEDVLEEVASPTRLSNHVVLIGYGRVGTVVANELLEEGAPFVLIEDAEGRVLAARELGIEVIVGNAATRNTLSLANVMGARCVVIAIPNAFEAGQAVEQCRKLNAAVRIIARAHADEEVDYLGRLGANEVIMGEREIGLGMVDWLRGAPGGRRPAAEPAAPLLARGGNILQQARERQSEAPGTAVQAGPPMRLEAIEGEPEPAVPPPGPPRPTTPLRVGGPIFPRRAITAAPAAAAVPDAPTPDQEAAAVTPVAPAEPPAAAVPVAQPVEAGVVVPDEPVASAPVAAMVAPAAEPAASTMEPAAPAEVVSSMLRDPEPEIFEEPAESHEAAGEATIEAAAAPVMDERPARRVVSAAEIDILPPDPSWGSGGATVAEPPAPTFRSEFWGDPVEPDEMEFFPERRAGRPLKDVQQEQAARAAVEQGAWFEALERDLFGGRPEGGASAGTPARPPEEPMPPPQPIETPRPPEEPPPAPQPVRPPERPIEEPLPPPQPITTPNPPEIPVNQAPDVEPERREGTDVDHQGRREPRLY